MNAVYPQYSSQILQSSIQLTKKSKSIITFGLITLLLNVLLLVFSTLYLFLFRIDVASVLGILCSVFHFIVGFFAIYGGRNVNKRCFIVSTLVMSIVGAVIFITPLFVMALVYWVDWIDVDSVCRLYSYDEENDEYVCDRPPFLAYFLPVLLISFIIGVFDIVLSVVSCGNLCSCCYAQDDCSGVFINHPYPAGLSGQFFLTNQDVLPTRHQTPATAPRLPKLN